MLNFCNEDQTLLFHDVMELEGGGSSSQQKSHQVFVFLKLTSLSIDEVFSVSDLSTHTLTAVLFVNNDGRRIVQRRASINYKHGSTVSAC